MLRRFVLRLLVLALVSCGGIVATIDGGSDASIHCATDSDCTSGLACLYPVGGGCSAARQCLTPSKACKGKPLCACDGTAVTSCGPGSPKPILSEGLCADAGPLTCPSGLACEVCDLTAYAPPAMSKPVSGAQACTPTEIAGFVTACAGSTATSTTCSTWQTENVDAGACLGCLLTQQSATTWGPYVCTSESCLANSGGCADLELGQVSQEKTSGGPGSCGDLLTTVDGCYGYVCGACADVDFSKCSNDEIQVCAELAAPINSTSGPCAALDDVDSGTAVCSPQNDADVAKFVNVFCGTGP